MQISQCWPRAINSPLLPQPDKYYQASLWKRFYVFRSSFFPWWDALTSQSNSVLTPFYFIFKQHFRDYNGKYNPTCFSTGAPLDSPVMRNCANFCSFTVLTAWRADTLFSRAEKHKIKEMLKAIFIHLTLHPRGFGGGLEFRRMGRCGGLGHLLMFLSRTWLFEEWNDFLEFFWVWRGRSGRLRWQVLGSSGWLNWAGLGLPLSIW